MNPYDKMHELARAVQSSDAYQKLKTVRDRIEREPETLRMLQDFRTLQWELQARQMTGQEPSDADMQRVERLANVVRLNSDITVYLEAEYQLSVILADLQRILGEAVEDAMLPLPTPEF